MKMKKIVAFMLALVMVCSCAVALADGIPGKDSFAGMKIKTDSKTDTVSITLSKPVDRLFANWPNEFLLVELAVNENLQANVFAHGHNTALGVVYNENAPWKYYACSDTWGQEIATQFDRAFVTLQGNWIVCYNRDGALVDIVYTAAGDIQDIRDVAFR